MGRELVGCAAPFYRAGDVGTEYRLDCGAWERFAPTAFTRSLQSGRRIRCDFIHNEEIGLASTDDGAVRLWTDELGLHFSVELRGEYANWIAQLVGTRSLRGASVSFFPRESRTFTDDGRRIIERIDVDLVAFALTPKPAYRSTFVSLHGAAIVPEAGEQIA